MGMAASQARLLSITTRLSDNELRSQLINNSKMRLATESSQVSERYIQALNESQYMFTNYDADNKATYQNLTFKSMTAYNEFNNQYGISNAAGQILVSETDGNKFIQANGSLNAFLKSYGLEYRTTYFDELKKSEVGGQVQLDTIKNPDGTTVTNFSPYTAAEIQEIYEGNQDQNPPGVHAGYENSLQTKDFNTYLKLASTYEAAKAEYEDVIEDVMRNYVNSVSGNGITYEQLRTYINGENTADSIRYFEAFKAIVDNINNPDGNTATDDGYFKTDANYDGKTFYTYMNGLIDDATYKNDHTTKTFATTGTFITDPANPSSTCLEITPDNGSVIRIYRNTAGAFSTTVYNTDDDGNLVPVDASTYNATFNASGIGYSITFKGQDESGNVTGNTNTYTFSNLTQWTTATAGTTKDLTYTETLLGNYKNEVYFDNLKYLVNYFNANYMDALDASKFDEQMATSAEYKGVYDDYVAASQALEAFIFGGNTLEFDDYANLTDYKWVSDKGGTSNAYIPVLDVLAIEDVLAVYGEPRYAYIKDGNPDANGDAEAKWYTNLFNRMQQGYKILENGLAVSQDWMRYALESGLVKMEQVDKEQEWKSITYASCSDITEQTNDLAVTIAEAEYQKAMNRIENKDKAYDMELKNIDTEHTALQTEYDSIKSALDKNVERNFKLYS